MAEKRMPSGEEKPQNAIQNITKPKNTPKKVRGAKAVDLKKHEYVSPITDKGLTDNEMRALQSQRAEIASQHVDFLNEVDSDISEMLNISYEWMTNPSTNPYSGIRIPPGVADISIEDLLAQQSKISNAFLQFGELLSSARVVQRIRSLIYDRRKARSSISEGTNETERKALATLRSFPEEAILTKMDILVCWLETRYFLYQRVLESVSQMVTTKSVGQTRSQKDSSMEGRSY